MRARELGVVALLWSAACVPGRSTLFDPVRESVNQRLGVAPEWRSGWERSPATEKRVKDILGRPLTAADAAMLAILMSPELQAGFAELGVVGGRLGAARTLPNPELEAEIVFALDGGETGIELAAVQDVSQLLAVLPRVRAADARLRAARRDAVALTVALASRARTALYDVSAAERILGLRRTTAEAATASAILARSLHAAGNLSDLDLSREELFEAEALLDVRDAEASVVTARERLNALLGLSGDEVGWTVAADALAEPPAAPPAVDGLEKDAIAASLELEAQRWRIEAAGQDIGAARVESFVPRLGLGATAKREGDGWGAGPVVTLSLPLWDWGQGKRSAAWASLRRAQLRYTSSAFEIRAATRAAREQLLAAHGRARGMLAKILPLRQRMAEQSVLEYNAMNLDAFELLVTKREQLASEVRFVQALRDYWVAVTSVEQLRAGSLPGRTTTSAENEPSTTEVRNERAH